MVNAVEPHPLADSVTTSRWPALRSITQPTALPTVDGPEPAFDYATAFHRNLGLVDEVEQAALRRARVAVIGAGGVGGGHALTLARMGVGRFIVVDPDRFEVANFNRQLGATVPSVGQRKAATIAEMIRGINPSANVAAYDIALTAANARELLLGVDVVADGLDAFAVDARIALYRAARALGIPVVSSGPLGMSATMHVFTPGGMSFERYFDLRTGMTKLQKIAAFIVGVAPHLTHASYLDLRRASVRDEYGPSLAAACMMCSGLVGVEVLRLLLRRPGLRPAPYFYQFDAYKQMLRRGRLAWGNRGPLQRLKRHLLERKLTVMLAEAAPKRLEPNMVEPTG